MKIYIVMGTTGEYSDRTDWIVCAFTEKELAEDRARSAMLRGKEIEKSHERYYHLTKGENEFDLSMQLDYTGTEYTVEETELIEG